MTIQKANKIELDYYQALQLDKVGCFYVDWDEQTNSYVVFGSESGFGYSSFSDEEPAKQEAKRMNR